MTGPFFYNDAISYKKNQKYRCTPSQPCEYPFEALTRTDIWDDKAMHALSIWQFYSFRAGGGISDNIELLVTSISSFSNTGLPSTDDLVTQTFDWCHIQPKVSCRGLPLTSGLVDTTLVTTCTSRRRAP